MTKGYQIPDVSAALIADLAKTLANSASSMTLSELADCYVGQFKSDSVRRATIANVQLGFAEANQAVYSCSETHRDVLKKADKSELRIAFRGGLQNYGPFLLFADYLSKGFSPIDAATRTRGLFKIELAPEKVERILRGWGKYAQLVEEIPGGLRLTVETEHLLFDYVKRLIEVLEAELQTKLLTIEMLGPEIFAYLDNNDIKLDDLAKALRNYEADPKPSASRSLDIFEIFVHTLAKDRGVNVDRPKGLMDWVDGIRAKKDLPSNLLHVLHGMVGLRNITHHNPDSETGKPWNITPQAALTSTLLVPITIRSAYLYAVQRKQEL